MAAALCAAAAQALALYCGRYPTLVILDATRRCFGVLAHGQLAWISSVPATEHTGAAALPIPKPAVVLGDTDANGPA